MDCADCGRTIAPLFIEMLWRWVMPVCGPCRDRKEREGELAKKISTTLAGRNLPASLQSATFGRLHVQPTDRRHIQAAWQYAHADPLSGWLMLQGDPGVGKTWLLAAICNAAASRGVRAVYYRTDDLLDLWRHSNDYDSEHSAEARKSLRRLQHVELLLLDELGLYPGSDKARRFLDQVMDERYEAGLPLVCATNLLPDALERYSPRIADRLADVSVCRNLAFGGRSWRRIPVREREKMLQLEALLP